jgi:hypothetical protein
MNTVRVVSGRVHQLLGNGLAAVGYGDAAYKDSPYSTFQASVVGTGAVTAKVNIEVTNQTNAAGQPINWCDTPIGTIELSGTDSDSDGFANVGPWKFIRAHVEEVSGTGAVVTCTMGV